MAVSPGLVHKVLDISGFLPISQTVSQMEKKLTKEEKGEATVCISKWHNLMVPESSSSIDPGPTQPGSSGG